MITADFGLAPANTADTIPLLLPLHIGSLYRECIYIAYAKAEEKRSVYKNIKTDLILHEVRVWMLQVLWCGSDRGRQDLPGILGREWERSQDTVALLRTTKLSASFPPAVAAVIVHKLTAFADISL